MLLEALMGSCLVEVGHIGSEHAREVPLMQNQQVVQTCLPDTPGEALADRMGSGSLIRGLEKPDATGRRYPEETGSKLTVVITKQIRGCLPIRRGFPNRYARPRGRLEIVSAHLDLPCATAIR